MPVAPERDSTVALLCGRGGFSNWKLRVSEASSAECANSVLEPDADIVELIVIDSLLWSEGSTVFHETET